MTETTERAAPSRGDLTRQRILRAALDVFGNDGFERATTRHIARTADVALPAIKYYFDNKEGLYLACAHEIVARYEDDAGDFLRSVMDDLEHGCSPETARSHLKLVMRRVSAIADGRGTEAGTAFVLREMSEQGPAFEVLYRKLWQPGVWLTAALIARIDDRPGPDGESHLRALMLHASLTAFTVSLPVSLRYLDDTGEITHGRQPAQTLALIDAQIDQLGAMN